MYGSRGALLDTYDWNGYADGYLYVDLACMERLRWW